jgi:hypothetical protein
VTTRLQELRGILEERADDLFQETVINNLGIASAETGRFRQTADHAVVDEMGDGSWVIDGTGRDTANLTDDEVAFSEPRRRDGLTSGVVTEPTDPLDAVSADRPAGTKEKPWKPVLVKLDFTVRFPSVQLLVAEMATALS